MASLRFTCPFARRTFDRTTSTDRSSFTFYFPVPSPMKVSGVRVTNCEFFRQQWKDHELGTGLEHRSEPVCLATLRSVMGKNSLEIFLNLDLTPEERGRVTSSLKALEAYLRQKTHVVYERFLFNSATQSSEEGIDELKNRLTKMASSCKYGTLTDDMIRDRIVIGVRDRATKLRVLKEEELDRNKVFSICWSYEGASAKRLNLRKQKEISPIRRASERRGQSKETTRQVEQN